jgi:DNA-binding GntR family transcriptional regulator
MQEALTGQDFEAFAGLDAEFNELCLQACSNPIATSMLQLVGTLNRRFWYMHHGRILPAEGVESHIQIARAVARGDAEQAAAGVQRLLNYLEALARPAASLALPRSG